MGKWLVVAHQEYDYDRMHILYFYDIIVLQSIRATLLQQQRTGKRSNFDSQEVPQPWLQDWLHRSSTPIAYVDS